MKLNNFSGKKFRDSSFCIRAFEQLKKDEMKTRIGLNILFLFLALIAEYSIISFMYRY